MKEYFNSETRTVNRSEINPSVYNPRTISPEGRKALKKSIKTYGVVGGIIINEQTGNTIVGGHQKVSVLDEINKYDPDTLENDYQIKAEFISVDEKTEKQLNITLNNPNVGGDWDMDALAEMIPDIDWKAAGLTENDLNLVGLDYLLKTEEENTIADELEELMSPVRDKREAEKAIKAELKAEKTQEEKVAHMKEVKAQVKEAAQSKANDMDAYLMLSFDSLEAKEEFLQRFGYEPGLRFVKGEQFDSICERIFE